MAGYDALGFARQKQREQEAAGYLPRDQIDQLEALRQSLPPSALPSWAELPATLATGAASSVAGGLAGLGAAGLNALGVSRTDPGKVLSDITEAGTYLPRSVEGMAGLYGAMKAAEALHAPVAKAAEKAFEATGSPALATAVETLPAALGVLSGVPRAGPAAVRAAQAQIPSLAGARPNLGASVRNQRGVFLNSDAVDHPLTALAKALAAKGASSDQIWRDTLHWMQSASGPQPPLGFNLVEIPEPKRLEQVQWYTPENAQQRQQYLYQSRLYQDALESGDILRGVNPELYPAKALQMAKLAEAVPQREGTLGEIVDFPDLFNLVPGLKDVELRRVNEPGFYGSYRPRNGQFPPVLSIGKRLQNPELPDTLVHELGHAAQDFTGLPGGTNPMFAPVVVREEMAKGRLDPVTAKELLKLPMHTQYERRYGEALSRLAEARRGISPDNRAAIFPWEGLDVPLRSIW